MVRPLVPVLLIAALVGAAPAAHAFLPPDIAGSVGGTFAVNAKPDGGGYSLALAGLWPIADAPLRFGVTIFADDLGSEIGVLRDPNDGTPLGPVEELHRDAWGAGWRMDLHAPGAHAWDPFATGTWSYYRVADDHRGKIGDALSSTGFGVGLGLLRSISPHAALGAVVRYHRLFNDRAGRYVSAAVEWHWLRGAGR